MTQPRVLIVRTGAMGDVLHALPAVAALRAEWPEAAIDWAVDPRWAPLLVDEAGRGPVVSRLHLAKTRLWSRRPLSGATARSVLHLRQALGAARYNRVIDVQGTLRSAVIARMAGSRRVAGFADPREIAARLFYRRAFGRQGAHVVEQNAALCGAALDLPLAPVMPQLPVWAEAEAWADAAFGGCSVGNRLALLTPAAGWGAKQWPAARFGELAQALSGRGMTVLVNAAGHHEALAMEVVQHSRGCAAIVVCDVPRLVALTRRAAVVIGGDTGPVHLAATLGRPVVALFGPTDPARNGPWGTGPKRVLRDAASATSYKRVAGTEDGLARIPVDAVLQAVQEVLETVS